MQRDDTDDKRNHHKYNQAQPRLPEVFHGTQERLILPIGGAWKPKHGEAIRSLRVYAIFAEAKRGQLYTIYHNNYILTKA